MEINFSLLKIKSPAGSDSTHRYALYPKVLPNHAVMPFFFHVFIETEPEIESRLTVNLYAGRFIAGDDALIFSLVESHLEQMGVKILRIYMRQR